MNTEVIARVLISIVSGFVLGVIATPVFCLLRKIFYVPLARKRLVEKAIKKGHVVQAVLTKQRDQIRQFGENTHAPTGREIGFYTYEYNGKTYQYRAISSTRLPEEITLYFQRNPRKALNKNEFGLRESNWFLYYPILSVILIFISYWVVIPRVLGM